MVTVPCAVVYCLCSTPDKDRVNSGDLVLLWYQVAARTALACINHQDFISIIYRKLYHEATYIACIFHAGAPPCGATGGGTGFCRCFLRNGRNTSRLYCNVSLPNKRIKSATHFERASTCPGFNDIPEVVPKSSTCVITATGLAPVMPVTSMFMAMSSQLTLSSMY